MNKLCVYKSEHFKFKGYGMIVGEYNKFYVVRWLLDHRIQIIAKKALEVL